MGSARLELEMTNASGGDLNDFVRVELFATSTSDHYQNNLQVDRSIAVNNIEANAAGTVYKVVLTPSNYRLVQFFVMLADGQTESQTVAFPVGSGACDWVADACIRRPRTSGPSGAYAI